jgi:hypothetical protein
MLDWKLWSREVKEAIGDRKNINVIERYGALLVFKQGAWMFANTG